MREFSTSINQALANGLKPNDSFRDGMFFKDLYNIVPVEDRAESFQPIQDVLPFASTDRKEAYPFPQWFRLEKDNLVLTKDFLYELKEFSAPPFELSNPTSGFPSLSESMRVADYGGRWLLLSREGTLYKKDGKVKFSNSLKASGLTKHSNRTVIGGAVQGLWTEEFLVRLREVVDLAKLNSQEFSLELGKNFIFWSDYDSTFFPFSLLEPEILFDDFMQTNSFTDLLYSNEFGYMEMPFSGAVLDVISSNDQVFVFGEDGIASVAIAPEATGATFHITGSQPFGIKQRGAVGGDETSLVFIDVFDQLWYITSEGLQKLDYSDYMFQLQEGEIWITKDPDEEIFYIGDKEKSFLLKNGRLTRVHQTVMSAQGAFPYRAGVALETGDKKARFRTQRLDLGNSDKKTLTGVSIGADRFVNGVMSASVLSPVGKKLETPEVLINQEGYAATRIFGSQHEAYIELEDYRDLNIDFIELKWQIDDRRQRRGVFTTQGSSGAG